MIVDTALSNKVVVAPITEVMVAVSVTVEKAEIRFVRVGPIMVEETVCVSVSTDSSSATVVVTDPIVEVMVSVLVLEMVSVAMNVVKELAVNVVVVIWVSVEVSKAKLVVLPMMTEVTVAVWVIMDVACAMSGCVLEVSKYLEWV